MTEVQDVLCGKVAEHCICGSTPGHDGPHECQCGGAWVGDIDGDDFRPVRWPDMSRMVGPTLGGLL